MKNRKLYPPILSAVILSLLAGAGQSQADLVAVPAPDPDPAPAPAPLVEQQPEPTQSPDVAPAVSAATTTPVAKSPAPSAKHTASYTVIKGDSLTSIARKFNTTRKKLRALNDLTATTVKPGQILLVPSSHNSKKLVAASKTEKVHHTYLVAQPVQDFDVPASTFASCPVPLPSPEDDVPPPAPTPADQDQADQNAPVAKLVSPAEMAADSADQESATVDTTENEAKSTPVDHPAISHTKPVPKVVATTPAPAGLAPYGNLSAENTPPPAPAHKGRTLAQILGLDHSTPPADDWGARFIQQARALGDEGIGYDDSWRPPGESHSWAMDCSNTTRYLYKVTAGIQLPRTASDQYYYLHLQGKAWDVPETANGFADGNYLRQNLKPGDLLFWENTYRPERQPPITHVMVYLGVNAQGQWIMAGSQGSRGGEHNRRNGGPDIYVFRPSQPCGGYTTWMGLVHHRGRFCAFGRPLEADPTKLAVAEND